MFFYNFRETIQVWLTSDIHVPAADTLAKKKKKSEVWNQKPND